MFALFPVSMNRPQNSPHQPVSLSPYRSSQTVKSSALLKDALYLRPAAMKPHFGAERARDEETLKELQASNGAHLKNIDDFKKKPPRDSDERSYLKDSRKELHQNNKEIKRLLKKYGKWPPNR